MTGSERAQILISVAMLAFAAGIIYGWVCASVDGGPAWKRGFDEAHLIDHCMFTGGDIEAPWTTCEYPDRLHPILYPLQPIRRVQRAQRTSVSR